MLTLVTECWILPTLLVFEEVLEPISFWFSFCFSAQPTALTGNQCDLLMLTQLEHAAHARYHRLQKVIVHQRRCSHRYPHNYHYTVVIHRSCCGRHLRVGGTFS